jgi:hypothetical protein
VQQQATFRLGSDACEATVTWTVITDYQVVYFATHGLVAGMSLVSANRRLRSRCQVGSPGAKAEVRAQ